MRDVEVAFVQRHSDISSHQKSITIEPTQYAVDSPDRGLMGGSITVGPTHWGGPSQWGQPNGGGPSQWGQPNGGGGGGGGSITVGPQWGQPNGGPSQWGFTLFTPMYVGQRLNCAP